MSTEHSLPGRRVAPAIAVRSQVSATAYAVPDGQSQWVPVALPATALILSVRTSVPARVRVMAGDDVIVERITTPGQLTAPVVPSAAGVWIPPAAPQLAVRNLSGGQADVLVTLTYLTLER